VRQYVGSSDITVRLAMNDPQIRDIYGKVRVELSESAQKYLDDIVAAIPPVGTEPSVPDE
jgi:hypothetical protein